MDRPMRVQLSRKRGWRMPDDAIKVDRTTEWGNPYEIRKVNGRPVVRRLLLPGAWIICHEATDMADARREAVRLFREAAMGPKGGDYRESARAALRGKNLACWCSPRWSCHADVLLELANAPTITETLAELRAVVPDMPHDEIRRDILRERGEEAGDV